LLENHYLKIFREQTGRDIGEIDEAAMHAMQQHDWPGNVRELVNVIERAVVLCRGDAITVGELPEKMRAQDLPSAGVTASLNSGSLKTALTRPERDLIIQALESTGWNRQKTARLLGINRTTLYKKMKKYEIEFETVYRHI
ncbi:MAG: helix-turn-helix domain-containing protein, partial [Planctomycetaceae bacterium]